MEQRDLRDIIEAVIEERWDEWAGKHPHLAEAIDRTRLISTAVDRLREDPEFISAIAHTQTDQSRLVAVARLIRLVEAVISRLLPI